MRTEERATAEPEEQPAQELSLEQRVAALVAEINPTGGPPPAPNDVLRDIGIDSLAAADLAVAVEERLGVRLADADVTELGTVADIARAVELRPDRRFRIPEGFGERQVPTTRLLGGPVRLYTRLKVEGVEHFPREGPVIVAGNHRSFWDIPVLVVAVPRPVYFMAKQELFGNGFQRWFFHRTGGFPVRREANDLRAIDTALALLDQGEAVGIYPEGTRIRVPALQPFLRGAAWLALHTGAPILPCGLNGTGKGGGLGKRVRVAFGPLIEVERNRDPAARRPKAEAITHELFEAIKQLLD